MARVLRCVAALAGLGSCQAGESTFGERETETAQQALGLCGEPLCFTAADTLLNTTVAGAQDTPAVATAPNGTTLVVYRDRSGQAADATNGDSIRARFFDAAGLPRADDLVVETTTTKVQVNPTVAASTNGTFLVAWADNRAIAPDASGYSIRARRFATNGTPVDVQDFLLNVTTSSDQTTPVAAATPDGGFLIAWRDYSRRAPDASSGAVRARRIRPDGTLAPAEIDVNSTTSGDQSEPALAVAADGRWAISFTDASLQGGDAAGTQVRVRHYTSNDTPVSPDARVNARTDGDQRQSRLAFAPDGTLLVVFTDYQDPGAATGYDLRGRLYAPDGTPLGNELDVATTTTRNQNLPALTALSVEGRWLIAFTDDSRVAPDISNTGIRGRLLGFDGTFDGPDQLLATATYGAQTTPALPASASAHTLIAWADSGNVAPDIAAPAIRGRWLRFPRCGDARTDSDSGELCDDGNVASGDGCSATCQPETCGDGAIQAGETCDDGLTNTLAGPCLPDCTPARCGDGIRQRTEGCDDSNLVDGDGCSAACAAEPPTREACAWLCSPVSGADTCNGNDDDCDGRVDEDAALGFDPSHCGSCANGPCPSTRPYATRLSAPAGVPRWDPSAAAVAGSLLWVANDRDGILAAYNLPLVSGANAPVQTLTVRPGGVTPKWESMRREDAGTFLLLNATGNTVWRCDLANGCVNPVSVNIANAVNALGAATRLESIIPVPGHLILGSRATPSKVADEAGLAITLGNLSPDGRTYQLSDTLFTGGRFYMTWSYEGAGTTLSDVAGVLAVADPDANGRPNPATLRICRMLPGKPEGVDSWGELLVVVFDQDDDRKAKGAVDPNRFELLSTEDFATVIPRGACP